MARAPALRPSYRQMALALRRAEVCLRVAASILEIPARIRVRLRRCADDADRMLQLARQNGHLK